MNLKIKSQNGTIVLESKLIEDKYYYYQHGLLYKVFRWVGSQNPMFHQMIMEPDSEWQIESMAAKHCAILNQSVEQ